jgi:hypothetical protein
MLRSYRDKESCRSVFVRFSPLQLVFPERAHSILPATSLIGSEMLQSRDSKVLQFVRVVDDGFETLAKNIGSEVIGATVREDRNE